MLLDMHWMDDARPTLVPVTAPRPVRRRRRAPAGFLHAELGSLGALVGAWDAEVDFHAGGLTEQDLRTSGSCTVRVAHGGGALALETELSGWMGGTAMVGVITAAPVPGAYRLYQVDTFTPSCQRYEGHQTAIDTVVFEHETGLQDRPGRIRRTVRFSADVQSWTVTLWTDHDAIRLQTARLCRRR